MVQQNNNNIISVESSMEHSGETLEQHPTTVEETHAYFESFYNNLATKVEKVNTVNHKMKEMNADLTTKLARYRAQQKQQSLYNGRVLLEKHVPPAVNYGVIGEISQKARILELKRRYFEDYYSEDQYAISIKEDMTYSCLHSPKTTDE
ncbi:hypothetical protein Tco_1242140 [Tanacetum coccineum]